MKNNSIKRINYKYFLIAIFCIFILFQSTQNAHAYTSSYAGKNDYDTSGGFYFEINGGPSGNSRIHFIFNRISGATSFNNMMSDTSRWSVSMGSSTNRHNVQIVDTSINTRLDVTDSYNVLSFRVSYDMPAHYQYNSYSTDSPSGMRFNLANYSYNGDGTNSAAESGGHSTATTRRTVNIQVNTGNVGLRTFNKYWYYNCTVGMDITRATRTVTQYHYYQNPNNGSWNHFNTTATNVTDSGWFSPYNVSAPTGYSPGNNFGYYSSSGASLGGGTIGDNGFNVCDNNTVHVHYYANSYSNSISHWAGGYKYGEGNNGAKNMKNIGTTYFNAQYSTTFNMGSSRAVSIPRGFYLASTFGTPNISGSWGSYGMGINVTQGAGAMGFEYYYYPYNYDISYNLNGGSISGQPTSYTVLYSETIPNPIRTGWEFLGWTGSNGSTPQKNLSISAGTIDNKSYTANWKNDKPIISGPIFDNPDKNEIEPFLDNGKLIIQLGDTFTPLKYMSAKDTEDGNVTSLIKATHNIPVSSGKTITAGTYNVNYSITDRGGAVGTYTLTVIVNDPAKINPTERTFFKNQYNVDRNELIRKIITTDKEDGDLTTSTNILKVIYNDRVDESFNLLDTSQLGTIKVTYTVTDKYKKTVTQNAIVNIVENTAIENEKTTSSIRFISKDHLNTLSIFSQWKTNKIMSNSLNTSIYKEAPIKEYQFNKNDVQSIKKYLNNAGYKKDATTNSLFTQIFMK